MPEIICTPHRPLSLWGEGRGERGEYTTFFFLLLICILPLACGEEATEEDTGTESPSLVIGAGNTFATTEVTAASGATITIINNDSDPHTITSESAEGAFDDTEDFDTVVGSDSKGLLTIPDLPSGTILFFYCRFHEGSMSPADGTIVIE